jgi:hypothetical protein
LIADDSHAARGMHCRQCLGLFEPPQIAGLPALRKRRAGTPRRFGGGCQQALDQKAAVTFIRDPDCRKAFTAMAPLRAWLRY